MKRKAIAGAVTAAALAISGPAAFAVGGPNSPGSSGHFKPNSGPCQGKSDQPNCPGPEH